VESDVRRAEFGTTDRERIGWRGVAAFLALAFGWSWTFWVPEAAAAEGLVETVPALPELGAFGPTVAAFALVTYADGLAGARRLAARAVRLDYPKRWLLLALFLSPAIVGVSLAVAVAAGVTPTFPWADQPVVLLVAFAFILLLGGPVQEEFGWRGVLLDSLQARFSALASGVAVGLVWALWHLPLFYVPSETIYYQTSFVGFAVSITLLSVLMTWVYNNTNASLLPALLFHASFNWSNAMFPVLESDVGSQTFVVVLALVTLAAIVRWGPKRLARSDDADDGTAADP
jgi:hypothetical protein